MAETPTTRRPLLEFTTVLVGVPIRIDNTVYEIKHPEQLSLGQILRVEALAPRLGPLMQRAAAHEITAAEEQVLSDDLRRLCADVLDAPAEVIEQLTDQQRLLVMQAFTQLRQAGRAPAGAPGPTPAPSRVGAKHSRGSRGSTAARRTTGSGGSRSV